MSYSGAKAISKSMAYTFWTSPKTIQQARRVSRWHALTQTNNKAGQLHAFNKRLTAHFRPGFEKLRQRELYQRNYAQHEAAIFCLQVLGKRKTAIPLR